MSHKRLEIADLLSLILVRLDVTQSLAVELELNHAFFPESLDVVERLGISNVSRSSSIADDSLGRFEDVVKLLFQCRRLR